METVLIGGTLIDGTGRDPVLNAGLVMEGPMIRQVGASDRLVFGANARILDLEGRTIMPGLIDCHTHLTYHASQPGAWQLDFAESLELNTIKATLNARAILEMGFTTIGDGGCRGYLGPAIRDAIAQRLIPGPRVVAAGPILCGSAGLLDTAPAWTRLDSDAPLGMVVDGPDQVRLAVRQQVKGGVDWIKVAASGVAGSRFSTAETDDLGEEEIRAAVREAAKFGKRVHSHAHSRSGVRASVRAGVLSLHSGEFAGEEELCLMREHGVILSPTIAWLHARCLPGSSPAQDAAFLSQARRAYETAKVATVRARELGVKVAVGTDGAHRFHHVPDGVLEMEYLQALGYPPLEIITAATRSAAEAIDRGALVGTLEPGKLADILVVEGDPARDVRVLRDKRHIVRMFTDGQELTLALDRTAVGTGFSVAEWLGEPARRPSPLPR
ncbi:MAG: amidohydrolase family protein [Alphaproteobacteria bacterium]